MQNLVSLAILAAEISTIKRIELPLYARILMLSRNIYTLLDLSGHFLPVLYILKLV